jgi:hypothetical protein
VTRSAGGTMLNLRDVRVAFAAFPLPFSATAITV